MIASVKMWEGDKNRCDIIFMVMGFKNLIWLTISEMQEFLKLKFHSILLFYMPGWKTVFVTFTS